MFGTAVGCILNGRLVLFWRYLSSKNPCGAMGILENESLLQASLMHTIPAVFCKRKIWCSVSDAENHLAAC